MEQSGTVYFSPKYSTEQVKRFLHELNADSPQGKWEKAVDMFDDRINGRYFRLIHCMSGNRDNAFAIASLDCLLIETLVQFELACENTDKWAYIGFVSRAFNITENIAKDFYTKIRCGLLHSAETKEQSYLWLGAETAIDYDGAGNLCVSVDRLTKVLETHFKEYKQRLLDGDTIVREKFICKMRCISCNFPKNI